MISRNHYPRHSETTWGENSYSSFIQAIAKHLRVLREFNNSSQHLTILYTSPPDHILPIHPFGTHDATLRPHSRATSLRVPLSLAWTIKVVNWVYTKKEGYLIAWLALPPYKEGDHCLVLPHDHELLGHETRTSFALGTPVQRLYFNWNSSMDWPQNDIVHLKPHFRG